jgi:sulfate transport system permease protein
MADASAIRSGTAVASESPLTRGLLIAFTIGFLGLFLIAPMVVVAVEASQKGLSGYLSALGEPDARAAIALTLTVAAIVVPINAAFGLSAAWCVSKFRFWCKGALVTLIDLPFSVSPVVSGLVFVLLFGAQGLFGQWLAAHGVRIIFAVPGIVLATLFVTVPFVARELIPLMQQQGTAEEEAALTLGAGGLTIFRTITMPNVKWAFLTGVLLTNARAMGEFGAVSVVSGHIRGLTNTIPLQVEILYNEYSIAAAFSLASLLACLALVTLGLKAIFERRRTAGGHRA